jgi:dolichyl-phosphate beta-glucosyltransferase
MTNSPQEPEAPTVELSRPKISVVIPAFNEERRLPPTIVDMISFFDGRGDSYEIIVANDGSKDATSEVTKKISKIKPQVKLIELPHLGKGHAVKSGVLRSVGNLVLMADADGATPIQEIVRLEKAIAAGADLAIGSRALPSKDTEIHTALHRKALGRIFNRVINLLAVPGIADTQCGFKLFKRDSASFLFSNQRSTGFSFDVEILWLAQHKSFKIAEVPINWNNIPESKVNLFLDPIRMLLDVLRFRSWHRDI